LSCLYYSGVRLANCILWGDVPEEIFTSGSGPGASFCDIQGGWPGEGNINADPLFVDPINGDYRLQERSTCVDTGNNAAIPADIFTDIDGQPRVIRGRPLHIVLSPESIPPPPPPIRVDVGAHEFRLVLPEPEAILRDRSSPSGNRGL
jgi:hypothetical protein